MYGKFLGEVLVDGDYFVVNGDKICVFVNCNLVELLWGELGVDVVMECMGFFMMKEKVSVYLKGGVKKVIILVLGGKDVDVMIVYGVNYDVLKVEYMVILNVLCMMNCFVLFVKLLNDKIGFEIGLMMMIYVYMND